MTWWKSAVWKLETISELPVWSERPMPGMANYVSRLATGPVIACTAGGDYRGLWAHRLRCISVFVVHGTRSVNFEPMNLRRPSTCCDTQ